jgi:hypothetical protein
MLSAYDKTLLLKLISLFANHPDKVKLSEEKWEKPSWFGSKPETTSCMSLIVFKPMNDEALKDFIYAYEIAVLFTKYDVFIEIMEKIFNGRGQSGEDWPIVDSPISLSLSDVDNAENVFAAEFRRLFKEFHETEELEKQKKHKSISQLLVEDTLTFENPLEKLFEMMEKKQKSEAMNTVRNEPKIMDFSGSKDTADDSGDSN